MLVLSVIPVGEVDQTKRVLCRQCIWSFHEVEHTGRNIAGKCSS